MRTKRFISCIAAAITICSCVEKPQPEDVSTDISINTENVQFNWDGGQDTVTVTSRGTWTTESSASWCRVIPSSSVSRYSGTGIATILCEPNGGHDDRECEVRFKCGDNLRTVKVKQGTKDLIFDVTVRNITGYSQEVVIPYWTSVDVDVTISDDADEWLHLISTKGTEKKYISLQADENGTNKERTGHLTVSHGSNSQVMTITQSPFSIKVVDRTLRDILYQQDTNGDGYLSREEALACKSLDLNNTSIRTFEGLQYFTNLEDLSIYMEYLGDFDLNSISSHLKTLMAGYYNGAFAPVMPALKSLELIKGAPSPIDLSGCPELETLACSCPVGSFELNASEKLKVLKLTGDFDDLDLSAFRALEQLTLSHPDGGEWHEVKVLLRDNPALLKIECPLSRISVLDVSGCVNLEYLDCCYNPLEELDVSMCPKLRYLDISLMSYIEYMKLYLKEGQQITDMRYHPYRTEIIYL